MAVNSPPPCILRPRKVACLTISWLLGPRHAPSCTDHVTWLCPVGQEQRRVSRTWKGTRTCSQRRAPRLCLEPSRHVNMPGPVCWRVRSYANRGLSQPSCRDQAASQTSWSRQPTSVNAEAWVSPRDMNRAKLGQESHPQAPPKLPTYKIMSQTNGCWWSHWIVGWFVMRQWRTDTEKKEVAGSKWTLLHHCAWGSDLDNQPQRKSCCPYLEPPSQCILSRNGEETTYRIGEICQWCNLKALICKGVCSPMFIAALFTIAKTWKFLAKYPQINR